MKKAMSLVLVLVLMLSLAACGGSSAADKVKSYVKKNGDEIASGLEDSFSMSSGRECESTIKAVGTGIVIDIKVQGMDDLTSMQKEEMQEAYDSMSSVYESVLESLKEDIAEVTYLTINVCEEDGDLAAAIQIGKK